MKMPALRCLLLIALLLSSGPHAARADDSLLPPAPPDGLVINQAFHSVDTIPAGLVAPPKQDPSSPLAKVSTGLRTTAAALQSAQAAHLFLEPAELSTQLVHVDSAGNLNLDIYLLDTGRETLQALAAAGFIMERSNLSYGIVEGWLPYDRLEALAALPQVRNVREPDYGDVNIGSVNSEGDSILRADRARSMLGVNGNGIKTCVLSDGVTSWTAAKGRGDLPAAIDIRKAGSGDEGTAMLEIIYDLAPGAPLGFYGPQSAVDMANGIRALAAAGCRVIVDDIAYNFEPYYQDGQINQAVQDVMAAGVVYAGSAGNYADKHYQGTFTPGSYSGGAGTWHRWSGTDETYTMQIAPYGRLIVAMQWNDPWGGSANDYDLYLFNQDFSDVLAYSSDRQTGSGLPVEGILYNNPSSSSIWVHLAIARYNASSNGALQILTYSSGVTWREYTVAAGSICANHHTVGELTTAAIAANDPGNNDAETFSSRGPVAHYFPSYQLRGKPDISGIDGVSVTGVGGFASPFYGTSAAAPHIAAIAALVLDMYPGASVAQVYQALTQTALDLGSGGPDTTFGYGRADAYAAVSYIMGIMPGPTATRTATRTATHTATRTPTRTATPTHTPTRTATPTPGPQLATDPTVLGFLSCPNQPPSSAVLRIVNRSTIPLTWTASETAPWMSLSATSGTAVAGSPGQIIVTVAPASVSAGIHTANITISSTTAGVTGSPRIVPVRFSKQTSCRRLFLPVIVNNRSP